MVTKPQSSGGMNKFLLERAPTAPGVDEGAARALAICKIVTSIGSDHHLSMSARHAGVGKPQIAILVATD